MDEQTKIKLAEAYAKRIRTSLYGRKPQLSDEHYKEIKDCNANCVFDRDEAIYIEKSKAWNDADQTRTLCQLIDESEKIISSNLPVSGRSELLAAFFNWAKEQVPKYRIKDLNTDLMVEHFLKSRQ